MRKLRAEMHGRMLGDGYCGRPVELDCAFESIRKSRSFFGTTIPPRHRRLTCARRRCSHRRENVEWDTGGVGDGLGVQAVSIVSDGRRQPTRAPTSARRGEPTQLRTVADAAAWLRHRATELLTQAIIEPSPIHATARRRAAATLTALAVAIDREGRTDTAAADALMHLARDYRQTHLADFRDPDFEDYQMVCGHLADTLSEVGIRLRRATAAGRTRRARAAPQPNVTRRNL